MFSFLPSTFLSSAPVNVAPEEVMADYIMRKDKKSILALYAAFADDMYHYLLTLSDPTLAEDIVQKTWLKVIENPHNYHTAGSVKAWLFTLARNSLIDEFRKTKRLTALLDNEHISTRNSEDTASTQSQINNNVGAEHLSEPGLILDSSELKISFDTALVRLSFEQREAFCLQQEGFSLDDIASMTHSNKETIKTRLRYAKTNLKALLEQSHD